MAEFPGKCVRCGGPQVWTLDSCDQVWVRCLDDACVDDQLVLAGFEDEPSCSPVIADVEPEGDPEVVPLEGGATNVCEEGYQVPPVGWLRNLWEGTDGSRTKRETE